MSSNFQAIGEIEGSGLVGYFGYGSLVNRATLRTEIVAMYPARLTGWRRVWRPRPVDAPMFAEIGPAVLTVVPSPDHAIDGMVVIDRVENLAAVDEREDLYRRVDVPHGALRYYGDGPGAAIPIQVYEQDFEPDSGTPPSPILRSYLDAVLQGFYRAFGEDGLRRFVEETHDFELPIHEDRHRPAYPRAVELAPGEGELFDALLSALRR